MKKPFVILFAGPVGSSKTPIAHHLSVNLNLPIFSNDTIRIETLEDTLENPVNVGEYLKRRDQRLDALIKSKKPFIYDAGIDRKWPNLKERLIKEGYDWIIISIDISYEFLLKIYEAKNYQVYDKTEKSFKEHQEFLKDHRDEVNLHITDENFLERLELALKKVRSLEGIN